MGVLKVKASVRPTLRVAVLVAALLFGSAVTALAVELDVVVPETFGGQDGALEGAQITLDSQVETIEQATLTCHDKPATRIGTDQADDIEGTAGPDVILALGGNDIVDGLGGDDDICGGAGGDTLRGGDGIDSISGQRGFDNVRGFSGADLLWGDSGNDEVRGGADNDQIRGVTGNDTLYDGFGADEIWTGPGSDTSHMCLDDTPDVVHEDESRDNRDRSSAYC